MFFPPQPQRTLCIASVGLAVVSLLKAAEKAREGNSAWVERCLTAANAGLVAAWVARIEGQGHTAWLRPSQIAFALSCYQLLTWWASRQNGVEGDFPVAVILFMVAMVAVSSMDATLRTADRAFQASSDLAQKISTTPKKRWKGYVYCIYLGWGDILLPSVLRTHYCTLYALIESSGDSSVAWTKTT